MGDPSADDAVTLARAALHAGDFTRAHALVQEAAPSAERCFVACRILQRHNQCDEMLRLLHEGRVLGIFGTVGERALATAMVANAQAGLDQHSLAESTLKELPSETSYDYASTVAYYAAYVAYMRGDASEALRRLGQQQPEDLALRSRYLLLRAFCFGLSERLADQAAAAQAALSLLLEHAPSEVTLIANAAHALAGLGREIPSLETLELLGNVEQGLAWTDDLAFEHFHVLRAIGWTHALHGEYLRAMLYLGRAKSIAGTAGQRMLAHIDHAQVAIWAGELVGARAELALAERCEESIDWNAVIEEEPIALIVAADVYSDLETSRALRYLALARDRRATMRSSLVLAHGTRYEALYRAAMCRVLRQRDKRAAVRNGLRAYDLLAAIGYAWRAARVALDLHELTRDEKWLDHAGVQLAPYAQNGLLAEVERRRRMLQSEGADLPGLSPQLRQVLRLLHEGHDTPQIALSLGLSKNTVRSHEARLRKLFAVNHRGQLLAKTKLIA